MSLVKQHIKTILYSILAIFVAFSLLPIFAEATAAGGGGGGEEVEEASTIWLQISKVLSPAHFAGELEEEDFSFHVTGNGVDVTVDHGGVIELPVGEYSVTESYNGDDPVGFTPEDWTVYWAGDVCYGPTDVPAEDPGSMVVLESDIGKFVENNPGRCTAENQFFPEEEPVLGCTDEDALNYDPEATEDNGSCEYDDDKGDTYRVEGVVWHDANENGEIDEGEELLEDWEVQATDGDTTHTTTSGSDGSYFFDLPEGTWILSETLQEGWTLVFPNPETYEVVIPDDIEDPELQTLVFPLNLLVNVAYAQTPTAGPFNFGNIFTPICNFSASETSVSPNTTVTLSWNMSGVNSASIDNGIGAVALSDTTDVLVSGNITYTLTATYGLNSEVACPVSISVSSGNGGGNPGPGGGGGKKIELSSGGGSSNSGSGGSGSAPEPEVEGVQTSIIPAGAPNTGGGWRSQNNQSDLDFLKRLVRVVFWNLFPFSR